MAWGLGCRNDDERVRRKRDLGSKRVRLVMRSEASFAREAEGRATVGFANIAARSSSPMQRAGRPSKSHAYSSREGSSSHSARIVTCARRRM